MATNVTQNEEVIRSYESTEKGLLKFGKKSHAITITNKRVTFLTEKKGFFEQSEVKLSEVRSVSGKYRGTVCWWAVLLILLAVAITALGVASAGNVVLFTIGIITGPVLYFLALKKLEVFVFELTFVYVPEEISREAAKGKRVTFRISDNEDRYYVNEEVAKSILEDISTAMMDIQK